MKVCWQFSNLGTSWSFVKVFQSIVTQVRTILIRHALKLNMTSSICYTWGSSLKNVWKWSHATHINNLYLLYEKQTNTEITRDIDMVQSALRSLRVTGGSWSQKIRRNGRQQNSTEKSTALQELCSIETRMYAVGALSWKKCPQKNPSD
jgi:hypothetical protein